MAAPQASNTVHAASPAESHTPSKASAIKDRQCKYCSQLFTSSSLGRHLDLFIKETNPKPPDGVHDVDEIRRIRRGITRRQARNSSAKREFGAAKTSPAPNVGEGVESASPTMVDGHLLNQAPQEGFRILLNQANWQATGVINGLPGTMVQRPLPPIQPKALPGRRTSMKSDFMKRQETQDEQDTGRAIELALKEVLGNIRAASARTKPPSTPFTSDDPVTMTFPALCLRFLTPPPTLYSTSLLPSPSSWSVDTPGQPQLEALIGRLEEVIQRWKEGRISMCHGPTTPMQNQNNSSRPDSKNTSPSDIESLAAHYSRRTIGHVRTAYEHFFSLPEEERSTQWRLELSRAYVTALESKNEADAQLARIQHEVSHLRWQIEQLNRCQFPKEWAMSPPSTWQEGPETYLNGQMSGPSRDADSGSQGGRSGQMDEDDEWSYEKVVARWKEVVKRERFTMRGLMGQHSLPPQTPAGQTSQLVVHNQTPQTWGTTSSEGGGPRNFDSKVDPGPGSDVDAMGEDDSPEPVVNMNANNRQVSVAPPAMIGDQMMIDSNGAPSQQARNGNGGRGFAR